MIKKKILCAVIAVNIVLAGCAGKGNLQSTENTQMTQENHAARDTIVQEIQNAGGTITKENQTEGLECKYPELLTALMEAAGE